uniref:Uncharacterized protein n=1 Tax=viral metagenome TaxID=1070528 RepID=A0A6M3MFB6_9ZZZZ
MIVKGKILLDTKDEIGYEGVMANVPSLSAHGFNGYMNRLRDVVIRKPEKNDILVYNGSNWQNKKASTIPTEEYWVIIDLRG